jgi:streptothricin hydrolase
MATPVEPQCLLVVDVQRSLVEGDSAVPSRATLMGAVKTQLAAARSAGALVVYLQNDGTAETGDEPGTWGWELAIEPDSSETVIRKKEDSGFVGTSLHTLLQAYGVTAVSVCGVLSEMCVAATARSAMDLGYRVVLAHDSHATFPVPPFGPGEPELPASHAARAAEWSLGDSVIIPAVATEVLFSATEPS